MNNKTITATILGGLGLIGISIFLYLRKQIQLVKQFEWNILDIKLTSISPKVINGVVTFRFFNKSSLELLVEDFYLDLYVNDQYAGWIKDEGQFVIPENGYNDFDFDFTINPQFILKNFVDIALIVAKKKDTKMKLDGYVKVKSGFMNYVVKINCDCSTKNVNCDCK